MSRSAPLRLATILIALAASPMASAAPVFFVSPTVSDASLDLAWQSAVGNQFAEQDFETGFSNGQVLSSIIVNCRELLRVDLDGVMVLLPSILSAVKLILSETQLPFK